MSQPNGYTIDPELAARLKVAVEEARATAVDGYLIPFGMQARLARKHGVARSTLGLRLADLGYETWYGHKPLSPRAELALIERAMARVRGAA